jgi:hypothetical protein
MSPLFQPDVVTLDCNQMQSLPISLHHFVPDHDCHGVQVLQRSHTHFMHVQKKCHSVVYNSSHESLPQQVMLKVHIIDKVLSPLGANLLWIQLEKADEDSSEDNEHSRLKLRTEAKSPCNIFNLKN